MEVKLPLDEMTLDEKYRLVDLLCDDIARHEGAEPSSPWHERILKERTALLTSGNAKTVSLEEFEDLTRDLI